MINQKIAQAAKEYSEQFTELQIPQAKADFLAGAAKVIELLSGGVSEYEAFSLSSNSNEPAEQYINVRALHASQLELNKMRELLAECQIAFEQIKLELRDWGVLTALSVASEMTEKLSRKSEERQIRKKTK